MHKVLVNGFGLSLPRKSVVRLPDHLDITKVVDWDLKPKNKQIKFLLYLSSMVLKLERKLSASSCWILCEALDELI